MLLIIDQFAEDYRSGITQVFPDLPILTVTRKEELPEELSRFRALVAFGPSFDDTLVQRMPDLVWIQFLSSGTDSLASLASLRADAIVTCCHGIHGPAVSEMAILHMLVLLRNVRRLIGSQAGRRWDRIPQPLLFEKKVTIVDTGVSRSRRTIDGFHTVVSWDLLREAAAEADIVVLLVSLGEETRGLIDRTMKSSAILVNVARGGVVDEEALLEVLREGGIAAAGLDAFQTEPLPRDHPFWAMDNVLVAPDIAGQSGIYADLALPIITHNIRAFVENRTADMLRRVERR